MLTYETRLVDRNGRVAAIPDEVAGQFLRYARMLVSRGLISSTLGNIAVRIDAPGAARSAIVTKRRGVSLEEMGREDLVVTAVESDCLILGTIPPSDGHRMNRAVMQHRPDVAAVIHTHPDVVIGYFSQRPISPMRMVSIDTALILGAPPLILPPDINLEADTSKIGELVKHSNCLVMPNHGLTTLGRTLSEAYHRHTAFVAEVQRLMFAESLAVRRESNVRYVSDDETTELYRLGDRVIYGQ
jgi:L-fuculose-phosphate aldolase